MTREEAISIMNVIIHMLEPQYDNDRVEEAVDMAIKALEQEPILDKIRAEIMQLDYDIKCEYDHNNDTGKGEMVHTICREEVLRIIDKYKAESEEMRNGRR